MEALVASTGTAAGSVGQSVRLRLPAIGVFALGFAPVLYLAVNGGGYDQVVYGQVGMAAWWLVLCGALCGALPAAPIGRFGWILLAALVAYATWTALGTGWSADAERSVAELGRVCAYAGFFVLALCALSAPRLRHLIDGIAAAIAVVAALAVLSRLQPSWFPADRLAAFFGHSSRLSYPLNYSDGLGEFLAMGVPLLLGIGVRARTAAGSALAAASLPVLALAIALSISRGGILAAAVGIVVLLALLPDRIPAFATLASGGAASAVAVAFLLSHAALREGLSTPPAVAERHQLLAIAVLGCVGVALVQVSIWLWSRFAVRPSWLLASRRRAAAASACCAAACCAAAIALGAPGWVAREWQAFKQPNVSGVSASNPYSRLATVSGSHRYQYWQAATAAFRTDEARGIGPGTFEFWWAQHNSVSEYVRNAHSLYMETLAELGLIGLALLGVGFVLASSGLGIVRALRAAPSLRHPLALATAAFAAFAVAAAYDWVWQLAAVSVCAMLLCAAIAAASPRPRALTPRQRLASRAILAPLATVALALTAIPVVETGAIRSSQGLARAGKLGAALAQARTAQSIEPYAATPRLQSALVLELERNYREAAESARQATARAPTDWQTWLVRSRIEAEAGHPHGALAAYRRAHALNPTSPLFAR